MPKRKAVSASDAVAIMFRLTERDREPLKVIEKHLMKTKCTKDPLDVSDSEIVRLAIHMAAATLGKK